MGEITSAPHPSIWWEVFSARCNKTSKKIRMKFFAIVCFVGYTQAFLVRREADAEPEADAEADAAGYGYGVSAPVKAVSAPVCTQVPVKTCNPREIKHPRKVCHQEHDTIVHTTTTEHCEEVITTKCEQTQTAVRHSSAVVGTDSKVVSTGVVATPEVTVAHGPPTGVVAGYGAVAAAPALATGVVAGYGAVAHGAVAPVAAHAVWKREADAEADADAAYAHGYAAAPVATSAPVCHSVPVKQCHNVDTPVPTTVAKTVCKEVVDIQIIEDCTETITETCTQTSEQVQHSSAVVGHDTQVGPSAVVASGHVVSAAPAVAVHAAPAVGIAAAPAVAVAGHAVAAGPVVAGYAGTGYGLAGYANW